MVIRIWTLLLALLLVRLAVYWANLPRYSNGQEIRFSGMVESESNSNGGSQVLRVAGLRISTKAEPAWHYGDYVTVRGIMRCYDSVDCTTGLVRKSDVSLVANRGGLPFMGGLMALRDRIAGIYQSALDRKEANLMNGIVLGGIDLDRKFKNELANVGLTHVVAASGMNVTLFAGFVSGIFMSFHLKRSRRISLAILAVIFYCVLAGLTPAVNRAGIMSGIGLIGLLFGRKAGGIFPVLVAAFIMLWVSPGILIDFGFLLSFASVTGQIIFGNFDRWLPKWLQPVGRVVAQTTAATIFTLPIVLIGFGKFSLISTVTNLLVLWTVEPLMLLGGLAGISGLVFSNLAKIFLLPAEPLLRFFLGVVEFFGRSDVWLMKVSGLGWSFAVGYYLLLAAVVWQFKYRNYGIGSKEVVKS